MHWQMHNWKHGKGTIRLQMSSKLLNYDHGALDLPSGTTAAEHLLPPSKPRDTNQFSLPTAGSLLTLGSRALPPWSNMWCLDTSNLCRPLGECPAGGQGLDLRVTPGIPAAQWLGWTGEQGCSRQGQRSSFTSSSTPNWAFLLLVKNSTRRRARKMEVYFTLRSWWSPAFFFYICMVTNLLTPRRTNLTVKRKS